MKRVARPRRLRPAFQQCEACSKRQRTATGRPLQPRAGVSTQAPTQFRRTRQSLPLRCRTRPGGSGSMAILQASGSKCFAAIFFSRPSATSCTVKVLHGIRPIAASNGPQDESRFASPRLSVRPGQAFLKSQSARLIAVYPWPVRSPASQLGSAVFGLELVLDLKGLSLAVSLPAANASRPRQTPTDQASPSARTRSYEGALSGQSSRLIEVGITSFAVATGANHQAIRRILPGLPHLAP